jgi:hypothetical protein
MAVDLSLGKKQAELSGRRRSHFLKAHQEMGLGLNRIKSTRVLALGATATTFLCLPGRWYSVPLYPRLRHVVVASFGRSIAKKRAIQFIHSSPKVIDIIDFAA